VDGLNSKLDYHWHLRTVMATRGMFSTSQGYYLVVERPERLSLTTLAALIDILGCRMEELIEPVRH
jgi:hypothetical protein